MARREQIQELAIWLHMLGISNKLGMTEEKSSHETLYYIGKILPLCKELAQTKDGLPNPIEFYGILTHEKLEHIEIAIKTYSTLLPQIKKDTNSTDNLEDNIDTSVNDEDIPFHMTGDGTHHIALTPLEQKIEQKNTPVQQISIACEMYLQHIGVAQKTEDTAITQKRLFVMSIYSITKNPALSDNEKIKNVQQILKTMKPELLQHRDNKFFVLIRDIFYAMKNLFQTSKNSTASTQTCETWNAGHKGKSHLAIVTEDIQSVLKPQSKL